MLFAKKSFSNTILNNNKKSNKENKAILTITATSSMEYLTL